MSQRLLLSVQTSYNDVLLEVNIVSSTLYDTETKQATTLFLPDDVSQIDLKKLDWIFFSTDGVIKGGKKTDIMQSVCSEYASDPDAYAYIGEAHNPLSTRVAVIKRSFLAEIGLELLSPERVVLYPAVVFSLLSSQNVLRENTATLLIDQYEVENMKSVQLLLFRGKQLVQTRLLPVKSFSRLKREASNLLKRAKLDPSSLPFQLVSANEEALDKLLEEDIFQDASRIELKTPILGLNDQTLKANAFRPVSEYQKELLLHLSKQKFIIFLLILLPIIGYNALKYTKDYFKETYHRQYLELKDEKSRLSREVKDLKRNKLISQLYLKLPEKIEEFEKVPYLSFPGFSYESSVIFESKGKYNFILRYKYLGVPPKLEDAEETLIKDLKNHTNLLRDGYFASKPLVSSGGNVYIEIAGEL